MMKAVQSALRLNELLGGAIKKASSADALESY